MNLLDPTILVLDDVTLGQRVRVARILRRWRQVDLAAVAGVQQSAVSSLERDAPVFPAARRRVLLALDLFDRHRDTS